MDKSAAPPYEHANAPVNGSQTYQPPVHGQPAYGPTYQPPAHGPPTSRRPFHGQNNGPPAHGSTSGPAYGQTYGSSFFVQQPTSVVASGLGPVSCRMTCPHCHALIDTAIQSDLSLIGWFSTFVLTFACCCCIPSLIDTCHDFRHNCPNCRAYLGQYRRNL